MTIPDHVYETLQQSGFTVDDLRSRSRRAPLLEVRCRVIERLRIDGWSTPAIGLAVGRHHSTVLHHLERMARDDPPN